jgi:hypothetical protein
MSFLSDNQNYIRMRLQSDLRNKTALERERSYNKDHQNEVRSRILKSLKKDNDFSNKRIDYLDLFELLAEYEFPFLLLCIYLDVDAEKLIKELKNVIKEKVPANFKDEYSIYSIINSSLSTNKDSNIQDFLKEFFTTKLKLPNLVLEPKEATRNDFFNGLNQCIGEKCKLSDAGQEIFYILLHFCKVWQLYYAEPYNQAKGVVLLHGMINLLNSDHSEKKIDLNAIFDDLKKLFDSLPSSIKFPPFLDSVDIAMSRPGALPGYVKKLEEFKLACSDSSKLFKDYSKASFIELFNEYFSSSSKVREVIRSFIAEKLIKGDPFSSNESLMLDEYNFMGTYGETVESKQLRNMILRMTYSFGHLKLTKKN